MLRTTETSNSCCDDGSLQNPEIELWERDRLWYRSGLQMVCHVLPVDKSRQLLQDREQPRTDRLHTVMSVSQYSAVD